MIDHDRIRWVADAYTDAWNSGSAEAVAEFYAPDGRIVINRGEPWRGVQASPRWPQVSTPTFLT